MNFNSATVAGRLVRDPENKQAGQSNVCKFTVASDTGFKDNKSTLFLDCEAWGARGAAIAEYFSKGSKIVVGGELQQQNWEAKDGGKRSKVVLNVSQFTFVDSKSDGDDSGGGFNMSTKKPAGASAGGHDIDNSDIPF